MGGSCSACVGGNNGGYRFRLFTPGRDREMGELTASLQGTWMPGSSASLSLDSTEFEALFNTPPVRGASENPHLSQCFEAPMILTHERCNDVLPWFADCGKVTERGIIFLPDRGAYVTGAGAGASSTGPVDCDMFRRKGVLSGENRMETVDDAVDTAMTKHSSGSY